MSPTRRRFLELISGGAAVALGTPLLRALAAPTAPAEDFFIFVHVAGGWDVMLWSDPRNEEKGLVDPPSTACLDVEGVKRWVDAPLSGGARSFQFVRPSGSNITFGPAIGDLAEHFDRLCLFNGVAMNTVSHPDGTYFAATGQHLAGSRPTASSVDTVVAHSLGVDQLFPLISARFPSALVGDVIDRRAMPLLVDSVGTIGKALTRSVLYDTPAVRDAVNVVLTEEANDLAARAFYADYYRGLSLQTEALRKILKGDLRAVFDDKELAIAQPTFNYKGKFQGKNVVNAAFAIEAMKRNIVRCVSFALTGYDTHNGNYEGHALMLQEAFDMLAALIRALDSTPHPTLSGQKLSDHTHILVISEFCRGPGLNPADGRDHYPNNSALVISPRFKGNYVFGSSDAEQLLAAPVTGFSDGDRPIAPPDVLATFLSAFGVDPVPFFRDGEVMKGALT